MTTICINKRGSKLSIKNGMFHVLSNQQEHAFAIEAVKEITISKSTSLSSDAILAAAEHGIEMLFIVRDGAPKARVWSHKFGSIATVRKNQMVFAEGKDASLWVAGILGRKLKNQATFIEMLQHRSPELKFGKAIAQIELFEDAIAAKCATGEHLEKISAELRGLEGKAGMYYFRSLSAALPEMYQFPKRSARPAADMFNALLNYAYGMLYGKVETALLTAGIDPALGIMHRAEYNRPVFTYDCIEPYRIWGEVVVYNLCAQQVIYPDFFDQTSGGYWLNEYGKRILISSMYDYLGELVTLDGLSRSRGEHINRDARELATIFRNYKPSEAKL